MPMARFRISVAFLGALFLIFAADALCQAKKEGSRWEKCQKQVSKTTDVQKKIEFYQKFIQEYPNGYNAQEALKMIAQLVTDPQRMIEIYQKYTVEHPTSYYIEDVREKIRELELAQEFKQASSENTVDAYTAFINRYPKSKLVENAKEKLLALNIASDEVDFVIAKALNTAASFEEFIKKYPESAFIEQATQGINELKTCRLTISSAPSKAIVYIGPEDLSSSVESPKWGFNIPEVLASEELRKGETPLSIKLEPGVYQVAVMTYDIPSNEREKHRRGVKTTLSVRTSINFLEGGRLGLTNIPYKDPIKIPVEGCMTILRASSDLSEKIVSFFRNEAVVFSGKLYRIKLEQHEEKTIDIPNIFAFDK